MNLNAMSAEIADLYRRAKDGVVRIQQLDENGEVTAEATGSIWTRAGIVVTVSHAFDDPHSIRVIHGDDEPVAARVRGWDNRYDLAVLEVPDAGISTWTEWGELEMVNPGEIVFSLGYDTIRFGIVSSMTDERSTRWGGVVKPWVEVDGYLGRRQAGGPLVTTEGRFVGINSTHPRPRGQTLGYGQLQNLVQSILTSGTPRQVYLGVRTAPAETADSVRGLVVTHIDEGSPAAAAGILTGDVLIQCAGVRLTHPRRLFVVLRGMNPGDKPEIVLNRAGVEEKITVELAERSG